MDLSESYPRLRESTTCLYYSENMNSIYTREARRKNTREVLQNRPVGWGRVVGWGWSALTQAIDLQTVPDVLGYVYLIEVSNPAFYGEASRIVRVGQKMAGIKYPIVPPQPVTGESAGAEQQKVKLA